MVAAIIIILAGISISSGFLESDDLNDVENLAAVLLDPKNATLTTAVMRLDWNGLAHTYSWNLSR